MKKKFISILIAAVMIVLTIVPTSFAESVNYDTGVMGSNEYDDTQIDNSIGEAYEETAEISNDDAEPFDAVVELAAGFKQRTSSPNGVSYYYLNNNPFYAAGYVGECTWYAWGRAYEILGSRPNLPTSAAGKWFYSCNAYPKSTNYWAAKVGAIACYSNHVAVVEAVGSNGAPSAISEGGYQSSSTYGQIVQPINERGNRYFHYGKDYSSGNFKGYIYILDNAGSGSGGGSTPSHTHSWSMHTESGHPHRQYRTCSCGAKEYTGAVQRVGSCISCYPLGNVSLTRSFKRTEKNVTFYRNNVSNANSYTLSLYRNGIYYDSYNMYSSTYNVSNLQSGTYTATLTVKNSNTGQTKNLSCRSFTLVDTYQVIYNTNGGTNAPSSQIKVKDENMTITYAKPTKAHYVFKGWASSKNATEAQYQSGDMYIKNTPITLYAVWEPEIYTIKFDPNNGDNEIISTKITYGNTMKMPNDIAQAGYYLKGWSKDKNSQTAEYRIGDDYGFDRDMTLYAVWGQSTWSGEVADSFAGGDGTEQNPYQISSAAELAYLAKVVNNQTSAPEYKYYQLTDNIGLKYDEWTPIGVFDYVNQYFYGSFDGNGYTISDLSISQTNAGNIGLFGYTKDSEIKNLTLLGEVTNITSTSALNIGELIGFSDNTNIQDCSVKYVNISNVTASDTEYSNIGCIAGKTNGGEIKGCSAEESNIIVKSGSFNMGIICGSSASNISDCSVKSTAELFETTGSDVKNIYMGGLCGQQTRSIEKCTVNAGRLSANDISATSNAYIGGLVGNVSGNVNLCTVKFTSDTQKTINGESYPLSISVTSAAPKIGGIAGGFAETAKIKDCMYDGKSISSDSSSPISASYVGGLIGIAKAKTPKTVSAQGGQSLNRLSLPMRDGYKATWYTDSDLKNKFDFSQPVTSDMTLYAKWTESETDTPIWDGTSSEPAYNADTKTYTVTNGQELAWVSDVTNGIITSGNNFPTDISFKGYTVELANDIYLNDTTGWENWETNPPKNSWKPIASNLDNMFSGDFNGNNHSVDGIYLCVDELVNIGLFGNLSTAVVRNVTVSNGYIKLSARGACAAGAIAGKIYNSSKNESKVENCVNYNTTIVSNFYAGGIVGDSQLTQIHNCYNGSYVSGYTAGGIVGSSIRTRVDYSYNLGYIYGSSPDSEPYAGGIIGAGVVCSLSYCYNLGNITGYCAGGIDGFSNDNSLSYCHNAGYITGYHGGGIVGETFTNGGVSCSYCYNTGSVKPWASTHTYISGIVGLICANSNLEYCYSTVTGYQYQEKNGVSSIVNSVAYKSESQMKNLSNLPGFSTSEWAVDSSINNGYPYLRSLEDTYKTYKITAIEDPENSAAVNRSFANIDGILFSNAVGGAYAGGIIGCGSGAKSDAKNLLSVANKISSKTSSKSFYTYSGNIIGCNDNNAFNFDTVFSNSSLSLSAVNTANSSNAKTDSIGNQLMDSQLRRAATLNRIFGPDTYQSLEYLKEHPEAVWVVKDGELPELYYNVLRDITLDKVENGTISVDKTQAVDGERVTVTAIPAENYQLNKIYVNGEVVGDTFVVDGNSKVYATFSEKTPEYKARVESSNNAVASLVDVDSTSEVSLMSVEDTISAQDGSEIRVDTDADTDYAIEAVYVNGEELPSDSFIITGDSVVTVDTVNISTDIKAVTNDAESIGNYFALLSGNVKEVDGVERYIRYWTADNPNEIYTTEVQEGGGDYSVFVEDLAPETTYQYQMCESGDVKSFTTLYSMVADGDDSGSGDIIAPTPTAEPTLRPTLVPTSTPTLKPTLQPTNAPTNVPTLKPTLAPTATPIKSPIPTVAPIDNLFEIQNVQAAGGKVTADITNLSAMPQSGIVIFAAYSSSGMLAGVENRDIQNLDSKNSLPYEFTMPSGASKYKIFIWNSYREMMPLAESIER